MISPERTPRRAGVLRTSDQRGRADWSDGRCRLCRSRTTRGSRSSSTSRTRRPSPAARSRSNRRPLSPARAKGARLHAHAVEHRLRHGDDDGRTTVSSNTFTTDTTNSKRLRYVMDVKADDLDLANGFDCVRLGSTGMANAVGSVSYILYGPRFSACLRSPTDPDLIEANGAPRHCGRAPFPFWEPDTMKTGTTARLKPPPEVRGIVVERRINRHGRDRGAPPNGPRAATRCVAGSTLTSSKRWRNDGRTRERARTRRGRPGALWRRQRVGAKRPASLWPSATVQTAV